jgi:hypothetical protein
MMNCEWVRDNISTYIDGELTGSRKEMIDSHLSACPECKAEFDRLLTAWDALKLWEDKQPPLYLKEAILKGIKRERSSKLLRILLPVAALLIITFSIVLFYDEINHYDKKTLISEKTKGEILIQTTKGNLDEDEIIANLQIIEEKDFFDSIEMLKNIDYLPVIENYDDKKSSMGYFSA